MLNRVMYVDDDSDIRMVVQMALETLGWFTVMACGSGQEALEAATRFAPDLIVLDVLMPDMDGPSTFEALRSRPATAGTPIVFMTARARREEVQRLEDMGALGVVLKPFDPMQLASTLRRFWDDRQAEAPAT